MKPEDYLRFIQIPPFPQQFERLGLSQNDLMALEVCILASPQIGRVIEGTNGVRKIRFSPLDRPRGKSGAYRVFYVCFPEYGTVCLLAMLAKNEQADLSRADCNALGKVVTRLKRILERETER